MSMDSSGRTAVVAPHATGYTAGALGIAASHRALWLRCSDQQNPFVICEDDAVLREDILDQLPRVVSGADDWISSCSALTLTWGLRPRSCWAF
jgi:GR25 family glycosyltransferase involved in LPS biosynthesis